jgi:hypothetical protein
LQEYFGQKLAGEAPHSGYHSDMSVGEDAQFSPLPIEVRYHLLQTRHLVTFEIYLFFYGSDNVSDRGYLDIGRNGGAGKQLGI